MGAIVRVKRAISSFFHPAKKKQDRKTYPRSLKSAMGHINSIRRKHGLNPIPIDDRALALARVRLYDLHKYHYFDHINPKTKSDANTLKAAFGFDLYEDVAENLYGGGRSTNNMHEAIDAWMKSAGHRKILLLPQCVGGATAAYQGNVVFIGTVDFRGCPQEW